MAKRSPYDEILARLSAGLTEGAAAPERSLLEQCLAHRSNLVVAKAAACVARHGLGEMVGALTDAFARLCADGRKTDKGCIAKKALVTALDALKHDDLTWFVDAANCVQMEPTFGGMVDTAIEVRCRAIRAQGRFPWRAVAHTLVHRTGDPEPQVRMTAIDMIASYDTPEAELVVLAKTMAGDDSAEVLGICFRALLAFDVDTHFALVAARLCSAPDPLRIEAAFALAASRAPRAFAVLREAWEATMVEDMRKSLLLAITTIRSDEVRAFLEEIGEEG